MIKSKHYCSNIIQLTSTGKYRLLKTLFLITGIIIFTAVPAQPGSSTDSLRTDMDFVFLKNGDRVQGKITRILRGELYFDGDKTGDIKIALKDIKAIKGQKKIYRVDMYPKGLFTGKVDIAPADGFFILITVTGNDTFKIADIVTLNGFEQKLMARIDGNLNFGYSYTKSSAITRYNLSNELKYRSAKWKITESFAGIYTVGDGDGFERIESGIQALQILKQRWRLMTELQYQRMLELGLKGRIMATAGFGKRIIQSRHVELEASTGLSVQKEYAIDGTHSSLSTEIPLGFNFYLFELKKPEIDITSDAVFYYNLTIKGRVRVDYKINFSYEIIKDFTVGFQFFYNYDSDPFSTGSNKSDFGNVLTVGYKF